MNYPLPFFIPSPPIGVFISSSPFVPVSRVLGAVSVAVGAPFLLIAVIFLVKEESFQKNAITNRGVVVEFVKQAQESEGSTRRDVYFPVFDFYDANGRAHHVQSDIGSAHPNFRLGDTLDQPIRGHGGAQATRVA